MGFYSVERARLRTAQNEVAYGEKQAKTSSFWKFEMRGLRSPRTISAKASGIPDDDLVIGVVVDGSPRAYWLKALEYPPWHIVNDVIDGVPVSVTYCDRTRCTRVYKGGQSTVPLDVDLGGLYGREMVVKVAGALYLQDSGEAFGSSKGAASLPYPSHAWERTTWKDWRERHPETGIFVGLGKPGPTP
jgi:hypothetical protein